MTRVKQHLSDDVMQAMIAADYADAALAAFIAYIAPHSFFREELDTIRFLFETAIRQVTYSPDNDEELHKLAFCQARSVADIFARLPVSRNRISKMRPSLIAALAPAIARAVKVVHEPLRS